jgi:hypothetical protein
MFASDSAVVRGSCATWPQAGLRASHARPRTKRQLLDALLQFLVGLRAGNLPCRFRRQ